MAVALRTERTAARAFTELQEAQAAAAMASAQREDERAQLRLVHNGPLTTLMMALHGAEQRPSEVIRRRAAVTLEALSHLTEGARAEDAAVGLDERLAQIVVWYEPSLKITADLQGCSVPVPVAEAFVGAAAEAVENIVRYAGTDRATILLRDRERVVSVTIADQGRGFDLAQVSAFGFGLREDLAGRMTAIGGGADLSSGPGAGTVVHLEWRRG
jgi:signal transduction histidine kinase